MQIIDADTHVDETEATWDYLREFEQEFKPITQSPSRVDPKRTPTRYWLIESLLSSTLRARFRSLLRIVSLINSASLVTKARSSTTFSSNSTRSIRREHYRHRIWTSFDRT